MTSSAVTNTAPRTFEVRHLQLSRAVFAAIAAVMITFTPDHSAEVGLAAFSGFAMATGIVLLLSVWLVYPAGRRAPALVLGIVTLVAGLASALPARTTTLFFVIVIAWAVLAGLSELIAGIVGRRRGSDEARDQILIGAVSLLLAVGVLFVSPAYRLDYYIAEAGQSFTLTGIAIAVGLFGGYAAIVAVVLGIAGFSPRPAADRAVDARAADVPTGSEETA